MFGSSPRFAFVAVCLAAAAATTGILGSRSVFHAGAKASAAEHNEGRRNGFWTFGRKTAKAIKTPVHKAAPPRPNPDAPVLLSRVDENAQLSGVTSGATAPAGPSVDEDELATRDIWKPKPGTYRTVCVRLCDGALVPMSFATTQDRFKADEVRCRSGCGSPARLFVGAPDAPNEALKDLRGNAYTDLPNAFKFTAAYDAACTCKGQSWETADLARRQAVAAELREAAALSRAVPPSPPLLGDAGPTMAARVVPVQAPAAAGAVVASTNTQSVVELAALPPTSGEKLVVAEPAPVPAHKKASRTARSHGQRFAGHARGKAAATIPLPSSGLLVFFAPPKVASGASRPKRVADMQRQFRAERYWRLSYWDVVN